ncbi:MAG TPA: T9SS type A sorting domain-containing protein [Bacteroidia bacterium]|nr:T9SS type A sorting domain-containing protein [Bacteroidia bacterium]HNU32259.1 T9SS type A sorting domain-containing protein [Bacteroidia bacterium]
MLNKLAITVFTILLPLYISAQAITTYAGHPSYTLVQLRLKNCIEVEPNGNQIYIGYRNAGMHVMQTATSSWTAYDTLNSAIPSNNVTAIKYVAANQLWVGTVKGLTFFDNGNFTTYNTTNSNIISDSVTALFKTSSGVWIGTKYGLGYFNGTTFTNYTTSNSPLVNNYINCIEQDSAGNFYFGTNGGLSYYDGTNWYNSTITNSSILNDTIKSVQYISSKACWIMTQQGLSKLSYGNFISFTDSTCIHPEYTSVRHNQAYAIAKSDSSIYTYYNVYAFNGFTFPQKINEDNIITQFNDTVHTPAIVMQFGTHSVFKNNVLWTACYFPNTALVKFDLAASLGSQIITAGLTSPQEILSGNLVTTTIYNRGDMFWDLMNDSKYEVPRCSGIHSNFTSALWMGGYDQNGLLHTSAMTYRQSDSRDYWPGPLDTISGTTTVATVNAFDNIWKFEKDTINSFISNFLNGNVSNGTYPIPFDILTYPAIGTGNFTRNMAPYIDYNNDGNYNPYDGDYPDIKGDQFLYWIFNDNDTMHTETGGVPLKVEIHGSAYAYYCPQFTINDLPGVVNYTTFYRYEIYNRSNNYYDSVFVGIFNQPTLGQFDDNYIGCDTLLNIAYMYNGDNIDGNSLNPGYGINPPIINCQILKGPEANINDGIDNDNDGAIDELGETNMLNSFLHYDGTGLTATGKPDVADDYYQYMSSTWKDGTHLTVGGNGYNPGSVNYTNFCFTGVPYSGTGWSEITEGNFPSWRRYIASSGPFSLAPGQMKSIDYAIVFTWDSTAANGLNTSIAKNIIANQKIKQWFDAGVLGDCNVLSTENVFALPYWFQIFPNPANDVLQLVTNFSNNKTSSYTISDITGRVVLQNEFEDRSDISIKNLSPSIYLITVTNGNRILTRKFVKQ